MRFRSTIAVVVLACPSLLAVGCASPTVPIPPPGAMDFAATCDPVTCPAGGVLVTVSGSAQPGALVVAENVSQHFTDGRRYTVSTYAAATATGADAGAGDGGPASAGSYSVLFAPQPQLPGNPVVSQHGDTIRVVQFIQNAVTSEWQESLSVDVVVP